MLCPEGPRLVPAPARSHRRGRASPVLTDPPRAGDTALSCPSQGGAPFQPPAPGTQDLGCPRGMLWRPRAEVPRARGAAGSPGIVNTCHRVCWVCGLQEGVPGHRRLGGMAGTPLLTSTPTFAVILEKPIRIPRFLSVKASHVLKGFLNKVRAKPPGPGAGVVPGAGLRGSLLTCPYLNSDPQDPKERLGCRPQTGFSDIKSHAFFRSIDWDLVMQHRTQPLPQAREAEGWAGWGRTGVTGKLTGDRTGRGSAR